MKPKTNNSTLFDKMLCGVALTTLVVADVLTIIAILMSFMRIDNVFHAIFWAFILIMTVGMINMFAWGMWKEVFNK